MEQTEQCDARRASVLEPAPPRQGPGSWLQTAWRAVAVRPQGS